MSLFLDIAQGAGLAGAVGVRPFLPPLLTGALARGDIGIDFDGTSWAFLESPGFLFAVLVLAVAWYLADRSGANQVWMARAGLLLAVVLGAMLFGGSLAAAGESGIPGVVAGIGCAALAYVAVGGVLARAGARLDEDAARLLVLYADAGALLLAAAAIFVPPLALLALVAFAVVLVRGRGASDRKYAGLRILR